jgi:thiamine biosynthesis lipoprotein
VIAHTFETMGTVVSVRGVVGPLPAAALAAVEQAFHSFDQRFSLYRPDSEISAIARGDLDLTRATEVMRTAYAAALEWRDRTHGAFTPHRPDGVLDLSGIVKALAIKEAAAQLDAHGIDSYVINAGGDILTRGTWPLGIVDPDDRSQILTAVQLSPGRQALATSGTSERGEHVWRQAGYVTGFVQASVILDDIVAADVWATSIIAGGQEALNLCTDTTDAAVLAISAEGELCANPAFTQLIVQAEPDPAPAGRSQ